MADVMILAAGLGTRMKSRRAKVLHRLAGLPLISYAVRTALAIKPQNLVIVVGYQAEAVERAVREDLSAFSEDAATRLTFVRQTEQRGTGHAVMVAEKTLGETTGPLLIIAGDGPMLKPETLSGLLETHLCEGNAATFLTVMMDDPTGYGRILRDPNGRFVRTVEEKDATAAERKIREVNVSVYCFDTRFLLDAVRQITSDNAQGEYYLTDVPRVLLLSGRQVGALLHSNSEELMGINSRVDLSAVERKLREHKLNDLMLSGVTILDPATTYVDQQVHIGQDTVIYPQVIVEGKSSIGADCTIQSWTRLKDVQIGSGVTIKNSSVIEDSSIAA